MWTGKPLKLLPKKFSASCHTHHVPQVEVEKRSPASCWASVYHIPTRSSGTGKEIMRRNASSRRGLRETMTSFWDPLGFEGKLEGLLEYQRALLAFCTPHTKPLEDMEDSFPSIQGASRELCDFLFVACVRKGTGAELTWAHPVSLSSLCNLAPRELKTPQTRWHVDLHSSGTCG